MDRIEAVFEGGVFKPLGDIALPENQRVRLSVEPIGADDATAWLEHAREHHRQSLERGELLPDSTPLIAEDRCRDV